MREGEKLSSSRKKARSAKRAPRSANYNKKNQPERTQEADGEKRKNPLRKSGQKKGPLA